MSPMLRVSHWWVLAFIVIVVIIQQYLVVFIPDSSNTAYGLREHLARYQTSTAVQHIQTSRFQSDTDEITSLSIVHPINGRTMKDLSTRVAIIVPYLGSTLPAWFDSFLFTAQFSSAIYDWLIFINEVPLKPLPSNVKMIRMASYEYYERLAKLDENPPSDIADQLPKHIKYVLERQPYILVEFKPCLGFLFADHLRDYSHWALADIDVLVGRIDSLVSIDLLQKYDIITSSFGDNYRMYMRGQLTIHKNNPVVNSIWKYCPHLSSLGARVQRYLDSGNKTWTFQSAEGCYSKAVSSYRNISFYVSNTQMTDAFSAPLHEKETIMVGASLLRCYEPLDHSDIASLRALAAGSGQVVAQEQFKLADTIPLTLRKYRCAYWVSPNYEVCLDYVPAYADIISKDRRLGYFTDLRYEAISGKCKEGVVFHFQGWKRNFYSFTSRPPSLDSQIFVISESGFIPFRTEDLNIFDYSNLLNIDAHLGQLSLSSMREYLRSGTVNTRNMKTRHPADFLGLNIASRYCAGFSFDVKKCICPVFGDNIEVIHIAEDYRQALDGMRPQDITLVTVAWSEQFFDGSLDAMLDSWSSIKVLVLGKRDIDAIVPKVLHRKDVTIITVDVSHCSTSTRTHVSETSEAMYLPDNLLFNVGMDVAPTQRICVSPTGLLFKRYDDVDATADASIPHELAKAMSLESTLTALVIPVYSAIRSPEEENKIKVLLARQRQREQSTKGSEDEELTKQLREVIRHERQRIAESANQNEAQYHIPGTIKYDDIANKLKRGAATPFERRLDESQSDSDKIYSWYPYPHVEYSCGSEHSGKLIQSFRERLATAATQLKSSRVDFNAMEFLRAKTMMYPVVFNVSATVHGSQFVRFPEEMSGPGCFGSAILRILAGAGYELRWPSAVFTQEHGQGSVLEFGSQHSCECAHGGEPSVLSEMASRLNKYYYRAIQLRLTGYSGVYSRTAFGENFEAEQRELIAAAEGESIN